MDPKTEIQQKSARKRTYSKKRAVEKKEGDESDVEHEFTNVDDIMNQAGDPPSDNSDSDKKDPPDLESLDTKPMEVEKLDKQPEAPQMVSEEVANREEQQAIQEAKELSEKISKTSAQFVKDDKLGKEVRRSTRSRKRTPKIKHQNAKIESKKRPVPKKRKAATTKGNNTSNIADVSEGTYIKLFWEPTKSWSQGIVVKDWGDGYFTIEFEDDVKEQGALSYRLVDYDWHIIESDKGVQKFLQSTKTRRKKRKRTTEDIDENYVEQSEAPPKKLKTESKRKTAAQKIEHLKKAMSEKETANNSLQEENNKLTESLKAAEEKLAKMQKERDEYKTDRAAITELLKKIEVKDFSSTNVMEKLKYILTNYKKQSEPEVVG